MSGIGVPRNCDVKSSIRLPLVKYWRPKRRTIMASLPNASLKALIGGDVPSSMRKLSRVTRPLRTFWLIRDDSRSAGWRT